MTGSFVRRCGASAWRSLCRGTVLLGAVAACALPARAQPAALDTANPGGVLRSINLDGSPVGSDNAFFQSLGSNGRTCASCHVPGAGWTITPAEVQHRFKQTKGLDPIFRRNDGSNSPQSPVGTLEQRRKAYSMLLNKGNIRVGMPIPAGAEFELIAVDDPYGFASARELSLFRRPMPTTNLRFLTAIMWDGRESFGPATVPIRSDFTDVEHADALIFNLMHQANEATVGHAEGAPLSDEQRLEIAMFELNLVTAQHEAGRAGRLDARGAEGGADYLAGQLFYLTINDVLLADVRNGGKFDAHAMPLFDAWASSRNPHQAAIARGAKLFGDPRIDIEGVGGLNDDLNAPSIRGSCTSCHDSPNVGNHSVALPIDIGLTEATRRTPDMPLYTLRNLSTGSIRQTTDPGRALLTGRWKDIGKFKGPILRGLASRPPYFHDGSAKDLAAVVDFYETRFGIEFTVEEKADLVAFLNAL